LKTCPVTRRSRDSRIVFCEGRTRTVASQPPSPTFSPLPSWSRFLSASSIAQAPAHLRGILSRMSGKVHAVLDRRTREVHINPATDLAGQQAFKRLHETSHDLFTWQHLDDGHNGFADDQWTLSPKTQILFEREANQGAAELLFQRDRFARIASDYAVSSGAVIELAERFGSSIHAAFRRYVETHRGAVAGVVLATGPCEREPLAFARKEAICSDSWRQRFEDPAVWPRVLRIDPFAFVEQARACAGFGRPKASGGISTGTTRWPRSTLRR
jgi:hypothetical protein